MQEIVSMLQVAGFADAALLGAEVHVTAFGARLVVSEYGNGYAVQSISNEQVTRVCDDSREVGTRPGGRGGKSADALGDDEGVATEHDRDVVVPSWEGAALEVIEPELALDVEPQPDGVRDHLKALVQAGLGAWASVAS